MVPRARAGQHDLVDPTLTHLRKLGNMAAGLHDVVRRRSVNRITSKLTGAFEYRAQLRECVEGAMIPPPESRPCGPVASITMPKGPAERQRPHTRCYGGR